MRPCTSGSSIVFSSFNGTAPCPMATVVDSRNDIFSRIFRPILTACSDLGGRVRTRPFAIRAVHAPPARAHKCDAWLDPPQGCAPSSRRRNLRVFVVVRVLRFKHGNETARAGYVDSADTWIKLHDVRTCWQPKMRNGLVCV